MENSRSGKDPISLDPMQPVTEFLLGGDPEAICGKYGISRAELDKRVQDYQMSRSRMALQENLSFTKAGRNDPCICGSGKKYKKCCLAKHEEARKTLAPDRVREMEERAKLKEKLDKDVERGFDLLFSQDFLKAQKLASSLLETTPEDDRLHDIVVTSSLATGDYDSAFFTCRRRWQVAKEERAFYQENGFHKREEADRSKQVYFYSPSTWLEKFWIAERARAYREKFPVQGDSRLAQTVAGLKAANDVRRFPARQEEGYEVRRLALAPLLSQLEAEGTTVIPHLLPLTYCFSWASLFVPELLHACGTDEAIKLLAELSMFRFPFFSQKCLMNLESIGERVIPRIEEVIAENPAFDELKAGLIMVLGAVQTPRSFEILARLTGHESPYVVNWAAEALGRHANPEALPYLEKAKERLGELSKIAGAIKDLVGQGMV